MKGIINVKTNYQRVGYADEMKYITSTTRYSTISQEQLIDFACENSGIAKAQMVASFYALTQQIKFFLLNGHSLALGDLGYFYLSAKTKATDNPKEAGVNAVEGLSLKFRQSSKMREMIDTGTLLNDLVTASTTDDNEVKDEEKDEGTDSGTSGGSGNDDGNNPL